MGLLGLDLVVVGRVEGGKGGRVGSPGAGDNVLHTLHFGKGFGELSLRVAEAVDARAEEEVGCCVQGVSVMMWHVSARMPT